MIQITENSKCNGCHACYNACPKHCIEMKADEKGFLNPSIDMTSCINCGKCEKTCPILNGKTENKDALQIGYAAYNKDEAIRMNSSSGGIFTLIAECIINQGGAVIGAAMTDDCKGVHHIVAETIDDLEKLRGSKYVQSSIEDTYATAKQKLEEGILVLFTGTPCQIGGLLSYLDKEYDNLYTQDLICHGVPSPLVWKKYAELRELENAAPLRRTFFRHKKYGWKRYALSLEFSNDKAYHKSLNSDLYLRGFLRNLYLRPSCYNCSFKTLNRQADITLADFWGLSQVKPEMDDDKGTSFVWIHSDKGKRLLKEIKNDTVLTKVEFQTAIQHNAAAIKSVSPNADTNEFWHLINSKHINKVLKQYVGLTMFERIIGLLSELKRKFI